MCLLGIERNYSYTLVVISPHMHDWTTHCLVLLLLGDFISVPFPQKSKFFVLLKSGDFQLLFNTKQCDILKWKYNQVATIILTIIQS